jgi:uncharacterized membrane protein
MMIGPMQLIAIGFESNENFRGDILRELDEVNNRGVIKLLDLLFVIKDQDGEVTSLEMSDLTEAEEIEYGALIGGLMGLGAGGAEGATGGMEAGILAAAENSIGLTAEDVQRLADDLEPGTSAAILLIEHTWAVGLKAALKAAGGHPLMQGFLTPEALLMVGQELEAITEAEAAIEAAEAIKGAAMLNALIAVAEAETIEEAAMEEAAEVVAEAEAIKNVAAAEAARALIVAGLIEEAAAQDAIDVLVAADLIEETAVEEAADVVAQAEAVAAEALAAAEADDEDPASASEPA